MDSANLQDSKILQEIVQALYNKEPLTGENGVVTKLLKKAIEASLDGELEAYLLENKLEHPGNRKNGKTTKTVRSKTGGFQLDTPRDRCGIFEPQLIKKRQTEITEEIDDKILALYGLGTSYEDISSHVEDLYGITISKASISAITDKLLPEITEWRSRPLESVYSIIFLDAMFFKVREDGIVKTKAMYNIMGIDSRGQKDILGFYFCESEGASFWLGVLNDLKSRGVEDVIIACIDGLKGFPDAIRVAFPSCEVQLCIVHQIRNSLKMVASKDQKKFMSDLRQVYQAPNIEVAEMKLRELSDKWKKYAIAIRSWQNNWNELSAYFKYSEHIRKIIYTTNPIEGFHRQLRKFTKTKSAFVNENALSKLVFCAINRVSKKWTVPIHNWALVISELDVFFPGRLKY